MKCWSVLILLHYSSILQLLFLLITNNLQLNLEKHASSDEDADISSILEDSEADGNTTTSNDYHMTAKPKQDGTQKQQLQETPEDSFTAHILIEQALHLPTVPGRDGQRYLMTWLPVVSIQLWEKYELSFLRKGPILNLSSGTNLTMKHHCLHFILLCINSEWVIMFSRFLKCAPD